MTRFQRFFDRAALDSRVRSQDTTAKEKWLGYFLGPAGGQLLYALLAVYLNVYYTDVLDLSNTGRGMFLTILPIVTNVLVVVLNVLMGRIIDKTSTRQGKARPWMLISIPILVASALLLFIVPTGNEFLKIVWVSFSYNLYYAVAITMYGMSHNLMVPLSTKQSAQRGQLSVFNQVTTIMMSGIFVALVFPSLILPHLGVSRANWILLMGIVSIIVLPLEMLEYFYTRERVTEATQASPAVAKASFLTEIKGLVKDRYVILAFAYFILYTFGSSVKNLSLVYYSNYVLGTYSDGFTQTILSMIGGIPMGIGVFAVWPIAKRVGKKNLMVAGFVLYGLGSLICWMAPASMPVVLVGQFVKNVGALPASYIFLALFADVLDHIELTRGYRSDGIAMSVYNIITTTMVGICSGVFNLMISAAGYAAPHYAAGKFIAVQTPAVKNVITFSFVGLETVTSVAIIAILLFLTVEKANKRLIGERGMDVNEVEPNREVQQ